MNSKTEFEPYSDEDQLKWDSNDPEGALMKFKIYTGISNLEDGSVVTSRADDYGWTFTTVYSPDDRTHPVSGNRDFRFTTKGVKDESIFFTAGVDRITNPLDNFFFPVTVFKSADKLWTTLMRNIVQFINKSGGKASLNPRLWMQVPWNDQGR